jgi:predicted CxxxxCH...CXXCH cytochrome family protein
VWPDASPRDTSHQAHLTGQTLWTQPWTCDGCHPPGGSAALTNDNDLVDVALSGLSLGPGGSESATFTGSTCSEVYCHGASMEISPELPTWNAGPAEVACGTCHGFPPAGSHVQLDLCSACHPPTGGDDQQLADPSTHIDGLLQEE